MVKLMMKKGLKVVVVLFVDIDLFLLKGVEGEVLLEYM